MRKKEKKIEKNFSAPNNIKKVVETLVKFIAIINLFYLKSFFLHPYTVLAKDQFVGIQPIQCTTTLKSHPNC